MASPLVTTSGPGWQQSATNPYSQYTQQPTMPTPTPVQPVQPSFQTQQFTMQSNTQQCPDCSGLIEQRIAKSGRTPGSAYYFCGQCDRNNISAWKGTPAQGLQSNTKPKRQLNQNGFGGPDLANIQARLAALEQVVWTQQAQTAEQPQQTPAPAATGPWAPPPATSAAPGPVQMADVMDTN